MLFNIWSHNLHHLSLCLRTLNILLSALNGVSLTERWSSHIRYELLEETPAGMEVGDLTHDTGLRDVHSKDVIQEFRFRFVAESVPYFDIGATNGIIKTTATIDRDSTGLCRQKEQCEIHLSVVIQPIRYLHIIKVIIEIKDLNDNPPLFRETTFNLQIIEAASIGSAYVLPTAADWDSPGNGVIRYELIPSSNRFFLPMTQKLDGSTEVKLTLSNRLDRESEPQYRLHLVAIDGGQPPKSGSVDITVDVIDSNDNKPEFSSLQYQVSVSENTPPGTVIIQVQATDRDVGPSGEVEFSFATQTLALHGHLFGIRNVTGNIYVRGKIDHEKSSVYYLVVMARDKGPDSMASEATVIIHVVDQNDNSPVIVANTLGLSHSSGTAGVAEDCPVGTFVAHVTVHDADAGINGRVNCTLNTNSFTLIQKYATEYQIVTAISLDRERVDRYNLLLRCQDGGNSFHITEESILVSVLDVNDNAPIFSSPVYRGTLKENNYVGQSVLQVNALDVDEGDNGIIKYSIPENTAIRFCVDEQGNVSAYNSVDREKYDTFRFPILAFDMGKPSRTGSALIVVTIEDVNDERPQFLQFWYQFNVSENEPIGTKVGTVTAEDRDGPEHNVFVYAFNTGHFKTECFSIDPHTGLIQTTKQLDRENQETYQLSVMVRDQKFGSMSGTAGITIFVMDRNDNSPYFEFPSLTNNTVHVSNMAPVGYIVTQLVARDNDAEDNRKFTLSLLVDSDESIDATDLNFRQDKNDGDDNKNHYWFTIDAELGIVVVASVLNGFSYRVFELHAQATDHGMPPRSTSATLLIVVNGSMPLVERIGKIEINEFILFPGNPLVFIIVAVAFGCIVVILSIFVALMIMRRNKDRSKRSHKTCRMETLKTLITKDSVASSTEGTPIKVSHCNLSLPATQNKGTNPNEVKQLRIQINGDVEEDSVKSTESSITDREKGREGSQRIIPPPPPPNRGSYWLLQQRSKQKVEGQSRSFSTRFQGLHTIPAVPQKDDELEGVCRQDSKENFHSMEFSSDLKNMNLNTDQKGGGKSAFRLIDAEEDCHCTEDLLDTRDEGDAFRNLTENSTQVLPHRDTISIDIMDSIIFNV